MHRREMQHCERTGSACLFEQLETRFVLNTIGVSGALVQWQPLSVSFAGPTASELATAPNPFLDYRLQVSFYHPESGAYYEVPGYFDGDGNGGDSGDVWRVNFTPDVAGTWDYNASFRTGPNIAIDFDALAGEEAPLQGISGTFDVAPVDPAAPGFASRGRLEYDGGHYYRFRGDGTYWVKGGTDIPENLLGYEGFDNTPTARHDFAPHLRDWNEGDPDWNNGAGRAMIGLINYFASRDVNSIYFLAMNVGGDGQDVWPFAGPIDPGGSPLNDNVHYDISKLRQWGIVFDHAQELGLHMQMVLGEAEEDNKRELDDATLGVERKLFYREMIARFGHHNAITWNIMEEYNHQYPLSSTTIKEFAGYVQAVDPYDHPITVHNFGSAESAFASFIGDPRFSATSFQYSGGVAGYGDAVEAWRTRTANAGRPLPIFMDELRQMDPAELEDHRKEILWPTYLSGGGGLEWYRTGDNNFEDFRPYQDLFDWTSHARAFMEQHLPFWEMQPADALLTGEREVLGGGQVFAQHGEVYALYLPDASQNGTLDLTGVFGTFNLLWFNPRTGQFEGQLATLEGGGAAALPPPPAQVSDDWVALIRRADPATYPPDAPSELSVTAEPSGGLLVRWTDNALDETAFVLERAVGEGAFVPLQTLPPNTVSYSDSSVTPGQTYHYRVRAYNSAGSSGFSHSASGTPTGPAGPAITTLTLINADTDDDLYELVNGGEINFAKIGTRRLNVRADVSGEGISRVVFDLNDDEYRTENNPVYALAGDTDGDYRAWTPSLGPYSLTATPYDSEGNPGQAMSITFTVIDQPPDQPPTPADLHATFDQAGGAVEVSWTDRSNIETGFMVERSANGAVFALRQTLGQDATAFVDDKVIAGQTYAYRVRAFNDEASSSWSNTAQATVPYPPPTQPPAAVTAPAADAVSSSQINLSWSHDSVAVDGFIIETSPNGFFDWATLHVAAAAARSYAHTALPAETTHFYRVRAFNVIGEAENSSVVSATTPPVPTAPTIVRLVLVDAVTDTDLMVLTDQAVIDISEIGTRRLNIRADVLGGVESVRFGLNSKMNHRTENTAVYAMFGDKDGNYGDWSPTADATYLIAATAFAQDDARGAAGAPATMSIRFVS